MSRSDNTLPWRLRVKDRPELPWMQILNTSTNGHRVRNWKRPGMRRWWSAERQQAKVALRGGDEAPGRQSAFRVRPDLW